MLTTMVLMTWADGQVSEAELTRLRWIHGKLFKRHPTEAEVKAVLSALAVHPVDVDAYLADVHRELGNADRCTLLKIAFAIASADGRVVAEEDAFLARIAEALEIPPEIYCNMLTHAMVAREFL